MGGDRVVYMFVHREPVRFRDLDAMGHVNNAVFLTYIESARFAYLQHVGAAATVEDMSIIVARIEIDFRAPVGLGEEVEVSVHASRFGEKSFDLDYVLRVGGTVVAEAKSVLVSYDYGKGEAVGLPDEWREKLAA
ncbi:MAG TPA: thioesterase family protein [Gaiellaceae bacterium]|nr:thioesterase family protein [Gaiellaceae bacterium]